MCRPLLHHKIQIVQTRVSLILASNGSRGQRVQTWHIHFSVLSVTRYTVDVCRAPARRLVILTSARNVYLTARRAESLRSDGNCASGVGVRVKILFEEEFTQTAD